MSHEQNAVITHHLVPTIGPFLVFQHGTVHIGDELVSVRDVFTNVPNTSTNVPNVFTNVGNCYMRVQRKFSLEMNCQQYG